MHITKKGIIMATKRMANKKAIIGVSDTMSGFTIIEVVLVLAIAGLIFMMVFIALPQLQRAQRDTQRRNDMSAIQSAITQFQANNNGKIPGQNTGTGESCKGENVTPNAMNSTANDACRLIGVYLNNVMSPDNTFVDPSGEYYNLSILPYSADAGPAGFEDYEIRMYVKASCDGESVISANNARDYAIVYQLEGSGVYCHSNNS